MCLDIPAREQVELALEHFPGTILLVSHDRYLLRRLAGVGFQQFCGADRGE